MLFARPLEPSLDEDKPGPSDTGEAPFAFSATGSIVDRASIARLGRKGAISLSEGEAVRAAPSGEGAKAYVLRFVHKGVAVVRGAKSSYVVAPGSMLPDAGRVLSIENRGGRWMVITTAGVINEPAT